MTPTGSARSKSPSPGRSKRRPNRPTTMASAEKIKPIDSDIAARTRSASGSDIASRVESAPSSVSPVKAAPAAPAEDPCYPVHAATRAIRAFEYEEG